MSSIMLDTCGLIWLVNGGGRLSEDTLEAIQRADLVYVSAASALEIGCKVSLKKIALTMEPCCWYAKTLELHDLIEIPVTGEIALHSSSLPLIHKDPADRIIIATAQLRHLPIVTHDSRFEQYHVSVLR